MTKKKITCATKKNIIMQVKSGTSLHSLEIRYGYQRQQIKKWVKQESKINMVNKSRNRVSGGGRKQFYPALEKKLLLWFRDQRNRKLVINYPRLRAECRKIAAEMGIDSKEFACSNRWIDAFCKRHKISHRRVTHKSQAQNFDDLGELKRSTIEYFDNLKELNYSEKVIYNMDETPCYFDMCCESTLHFKGENTVEALSTGNTKKRFTVVLCASTKGTFLRTMIIFKGLKKVPKIRLPSNIFVAVSDGGSMNGDLMKQWSLNCFNKKGNLFLSESSLILMDSFGSHKRDDVLNLLTKKCKTCVVFIPPKTTSFLQPLDVSINHPFKTKLRELWNDWIETTSPEFTKSGKYLCLF